MTIMDERKMMRIDGIPLGWRMRERLIDMWQTEQQIRGYLTDSGYEYAIRMLDSAAQTLYKHALITRVTGTSRTFTVKLTDRGREVAKKLVVLLQLMGQEAKRGCMILVYSETGEGKTTSCFEDDYADGYNYSGRSKAYIGSGA